MNTLLRDNPLTRFATGFSYPLRAFRFLNRHPGLYRWVAIPLLINIVVFSGVGYFAFDLVQGLAAHYLPPGEGWSGQLLRYLFLLLAGLLSLGVVFFTFATLGSLIASPFNDLLSARTEVLCAGGLREEPFALSLFFRDAKLVLVLECKKIFFFFGGMVLLLPLHLLPGAGALLYGFLSLFWTVLFLVVEYSGYTLTRHRFTFAAQRRLLLSRAALLLGFGSALFLLLMIPLLQFLCIPLGVVGATLLLHEQGMVGE